jgi:hypothetical protein
MMRIALPCLLALLVAACGDDGSSSLPTGSFRLVAETVGGATTPAERLHGALQVTESDVALGLASAQLGGALGAYTMSGSTLSVTGGPTYETTVEGERVTLAQGTNRWTFQRFTPAASNTLPVTGTVTVPAGQPALVQPRVAVVFVSADMPYVNSPRDDHPLTFTDGVATFDESRDDGPLGIEVLEWEPHVVVTSIAYVLVYEDRDGSANLNELAVCTSSTVDCIRAVSPILIAFRMGDNAALAASQYAQLRGGWSAAVPVQHRTVGKLGVVSLDEGAYVHDLTIGDPGAVTIPQFDVTIP